MKTAGNTGVALQILYVKQKEVTNAMADLFVDDLPISWPEKPSVRKFHGKVASRWKPV